MKGQPLYNMKDKRGQHKRMENEHECFMFNMRSSRHELSSYSLTRLGGVVCTVYGPGVIIMIAAKLLSMLSGSGVTEPSVEIETSFLTPPAVILG